MKIIRINKEGQITIPHQFRADLNLKPDMKLCLYLEEGKIIIEPLSEDPIDILLELLKGEPSEEKNNDLKPGETED